MKGELQLMYLSEKVIKSFDDVLETVHVELS